MSYPKPRPTLTALLTTLIAALLTGAAVAAEWTETFERTLPAQAAIEALTSSGEIRVTESDDGRIHVRGVVTARDVFQRDARALAERVVSDPPVVAGDPLRIGDLTPYNLRFSPFRSVAIDLEIAVPRGTDVTASSSSGAVAILGVEGPVRASASSGDIVVEGATGAVSANASSGAVRVTGARGAVAVETSSGAITLHDIEGPVEADASSGEVTLTGRLGTVAVTTSSGEVRIDSDRAPVGAWSVRTSSGNVALALPEGADFDLSYRTSSGGFRSDLPFSGGSERNAVEGAVGDGGPTVEIRTSSGDLRVSLR